MLFRSTFNLEPAGSLSGRLDGVGGNNTLDYASYGSSTAVNFETRSATGLFLGAANGFSNIENFIGSGNAGAGGDTFTGLNSGVIYTIDGADDFEFNSGGTIEVIDYANLNGGTGNDIFNIEPAGSLSGQLDGIGGNNTLDYASYGSSTAVNFETRSATGLFLFGARWEAYRISIEIPDTP